MNTKPEIVDTSTVMWEFERINWSRGPVGITARIALALNTLEVLERAASAKKDNLFYWSMSGTLNTKDIVSNDTNRRVRIATEAGYYLPVSQAVTYTPYIEFFDFMDKYGHLLGDDRIIIAALREVLDTTQDLAINSKNEHDWQKKRSKYAELLSDSDYELRTQNDSTDAIAQEFSYLSEFEDKKSTSPRTSTHEMAMRIMSEFFSALTYKQNFDAPTSDAIQAIRIRHQKWCQKFSKSNLYIVTSPWVKSADDPYAGIGGSPRDGNSVPFNPQTKSI